jgi:hypothetical protein
LNGTRERNTLYNHHLKMDPYLNHGKWQPSEKQAFEEALAFFTSRNWQEISEYVGTRRAAQCKERYENKYLNPEKYRAWSREEDKRLLEACDIYEKQWSRIAANEFPSRTDHACLFRYNKLMGWREQTEWFENQPVQIQEFIMMLYGKKKANDADDEEEMRTATGEPVPKQPKFILSSATLPNLMEVLNERTYMIVEFVEKKREGVFDATLLMNIGVPMFHINRLIARHRKGELVPEKKIGKRGRKKLDEPRERSSTVREKLRKMLQENGSLNTFDDQVVAAGSSQFKPTRKYKKRTEKNEKKTKKSDGETNNAETLEILSDLDLTELDLADFQGDIEQPHTSTMNIVDNMKLKIRKLRGKYKKRAKDENVATTSNSTEISKKKKGPKVKEPRKLDEISAKENNAVSMNRNENEAPVIASEASNVANQIPIKNKRQRRKKLKSKCCLEKNFKFILNLFKRIN